MNDVTSSGGGLPLWRRLYQWYRRSHANWWLGLPMLSAFIFSFLASEDYSGLVDAARTAPRYSYEGVITRPFRSRLRGFYVRLKNGERHRIVCKPPRLRRASCLSGQDFPFDAKVKTFKYNGHEIILEISNLSQDIIVSESSQIRSLGFVERVRHDRGYISEFIVGLFVGLFLFIPTGLLFIGFEKLLRSRQRGKDA